jgi:hypothetical protein
VRGMRQLKKFAVVLWVRKTDAVKAVRQQLVSIAEDTLDANQLSQRRRDRAVIAAGVKS